MRRQLLVCLAVLALAGSPALAQTANVLEVIPEDVPAFFLINRIGQADQKLTALAKSVHVPVPGSLLAKAKAELGIQQGLDEQGSAAVILFAPPEGGGGPRSRPASLSCRSVIISSSCRD